MINIVLQRDELKFLLDHLKLMPASLSPLKEVAADKALAATHQKKVMAGLKKGGVMIGTKAAELTVGEVTVAAMGILAKPLSILEMYFVGPKGQERRYFYGHKHTFFELLTTAANTYLVNGPYTEEMLRGFVLKDLIAGAAQSWELAFKGDEIPVLSAMLNLGKTSFGATELSPTANNATQQAFAQMYANLVPQDASGVLDRLVVNKVLIKSGDQYSFGPSLAAFKAIRAQNRYAQITRTDLAPNAGLRTLMLWQGDKELVVQQVIPGQLPALLLKSVDMIQATVMISMVTLSADSFMTQFGDALGIKTEAPAASVAAQSVEPTGPAAASKTEAQSNFVEASKCPKCGADLPTNAKFCRACGTKLDALQAMPIEPAKPAANQCKQCHQPLPVGAKFCRECGAKQDV